MKMSTATLVENKQTVREAFNFTVDKFPLGGPDGLKTNLKGLFRSDNNQHIGKVVSTKYVPHQTEDVVLLTEAAQVAFDGNIEVKCHFNNGHYVEISPSVEYRKSIFGEKDNIFPRIMIDASYNGLAFKLILGYFRDLCKNMVMMNEVRTACVSIRHSRKLPEQMEQLIKQFSSLKEGWQSLSSMIERMENTEVNLASFMNQVYGDPKDSERGRTIHEDRTQIIFTRLADERLRSGRPAMDRLNTKVSAWEAFNAVQGFAQHITTRKEGTTDFDKVILAAKTTEVHTAQKLALQLTGMGV